MKTKMMLFLSPMLMSFVVNAAGSRLHYGPQIENEGKGGAIKARHNVGVVTVKSMKNSSSKKTDVKSKAPLNLNQE